MGVVDAAEREGDVEGVALELLPAFFGGTQVLDVLGVGFAVGLGEFWGFGDVAGAEVVVEVGLELLPSDEAGCWEAYWARSAEGARALLMLNSMLMLSGLCGGCPPAAWPSLIGC